MANVKRVFIDGQIPFDIPFDSKANQFLGMLNLPSFGLRIQWGKTKLIPNSHGGQTCHYDFTITGNEAVRIETILALLQSFVDEKAEIKQVDILDIENNTPISIKIPQKKV